MQNLLILDSICYKQANHTLLSDISFSLAKGEVVGLLGVNGAGKSTTLKIAAKLLTPSNGTITFDSRSVVGYLPEIPPLIDTWSVSRFLNHICSLHKILPPQRGGRIEAVIKICDLKQIINQSIATLSKGNRQRVSIACSIIHNPDILILDEPTSGLDPQQINQFRSIIERLKENTAILFSSHIMHEITSLCDRVVVIHQGKKMGELPLKQEKMNILVEFFTNISEQKIKQIPEWQSGSGKFHQFTIHNADSQQQLIETLRESDMPIARISGAENIMEKTFLAMIGQTGIDTIEDQPS